MIVEGIIVIWSGAIVDIPDGWTLCDGNNGTPDLRDRFVVGAGDTYAVDETGGSVAHTHTFTSDGHSHILQDGSDFAGPGGSDEVTTTDNDSGTTDPTDHLPPYFALAYIMKVN